MAKAYKSEKYTKAMINLEDKTITEVTKDDCIIYSLEELLKRWDGIENISISLSTDEEIPSIDEE